MRRLCRGGMERGGEGTKDSHMTHKRIHKRTVKWIHKATHTRCPHTMFRRENGSCPVTDRSHGAMSA